MPRIHLALVFTVSLVLACGDDSTSDASVAVDATTADVVAADAVSSADVGADDAASGDASTADASTADASTADASTADAASDAAVADASTSDAGSTCEIQIDDRIAGACDGRGMLACTNWANEHGGASAVAQCVRPEGRCARADACTDAGCTCGSEPECGDGAMCVSGFAGFGCVCISPPDDAP